MLVGQAFLPFGQGPRGGPSRSLGGVSRGRRRKPRGQDPAGPVDDPSRFERYDEADPDEPERAYWDLGHEPAQPPGQPERDAQGPAPEPAPGTQAAKAAWPPAQPEPAWRDPEPTTDWRHPEPEPEPDWRHPEPDWRRAEPEPEPGWR